MIPDGGIIRKAVKATIGYIYMMNPYETVELLAPAGNLACLHAAVRAGANAVYLGTEDFNARRGADNFTLDTLAQACDYAHLRGVNVYLTLNIAVMPQEVKRVLEPGAPGVASRR